jgi:hypothetical protein
MEEGPGMDQSAAARRELTLLLGSWALDMALRPSIRAMAQFFILTYSRPSRQGLSVFAFALF